MIKALEIPLSLYIHIPWCEKKCPYCDFNSHDNQQHFDETAYVQALLDDLGQDLDLFKGSLDRPIQSIFIGGGTPSLFSPAAYQTLLSEIAKRVDIKQAEITIEANPSSSEQQKFAAYRDAGINRLSIGTQTYNASLLAKIGRIHSQADALNAAESAKGAGFTNINLDIMFALPGQTVAQAINDIEQAISFSPQHLSCYQLTLEPNTLFYQQRPKLPSTDAAWEMQSALQSRLTIAGYQQYEVSAYAQAKQQCRHNLNYWQFGDYLAIGAGAHGKITQTSGDIHRYWKHKQPKQYLKTAATTERLGADSSIASQALAFEFMLNALRLKQGFQIELFTERTGLHFDNIKTIVDQHIQQGLLQHEQNCLTPTEQGYQFVDSMLNDYLP